MREADVAGKRDVASVRVVQEARPRRVSSDETPIGTMCHEGEIDA